MSSRSSSRDRLLDAASALIRRKGFAATSVDEICAEAGVTKGAFFHHFASKEALGVAAAERWGEMGRTLAAGLHDEAATPFGRVMAYLDRREAMIGEGEEDFTCLAGTLIQEVHQSHPAIREAAAEAIGSTAASIEADVAAMLKEAGVRGVEARGLAEHIQMALQGGVVMAKASGDPAAARDALRHVRRYIQLLCNAEVNDER